MAFSSPARWSDLQRQLKPGPSIRAALPAALLRALTWLILPWLLRAMLKQSISIPLGLVLATLSLLFGQLLDNHWKRLWLNRSERQRAALPWWAPCCACPLHLKELAMQTLLWH